MSTLTRDRDVDARPWRRLRSVVRTLQWVGGTGARRASLAFVVLIVAGGAVAAAFLPPQVTVSSPRTMSLHDEAVGIGLVKAKVLVGVGAKITGVIVATHVDQGDRVTAGQVLAELKNTDLLGQLRQAGHQLDAQRASMSTARANVVAARARLQASVSALEKAKAARRLADVTVERTRSLFADAIVSRSELDAAETRQAEAAREVENLEALRAASAEQVTAAESGAEAAARVTDVSVAGVKVQEANLAYTVVRSPMDGYVVTRDLEQGATVVPGLPIFTIADSSLIWVSANIDERELAGLQVGQTASITLRSDPARTIPGTVARIAEMADPVTEEVLVDVAFAERRPTVRLNETAEVVIAKRDAPTRSAVPFTALAGDAYGPAVWVVRNARLERQPVNVGVRDKRGWVEISSGVTPTDLVVVNPSLEVGLETGLRVRTRAAAVR